MYTTADSILWLGISLCACASVGLLIVALYGQPLRTYCQKTSLFTPFNVCMLGIIIGIIILGYWLNYRPLTTH